MGDPKATSSSSSFSLPPGCRFYPSEEQLLCYYLHHKNDNSSSSSSLSDSNPNFYGAIKEINLYDFNPFELPVVTSFRFGYRGRKRHWYCYTERINGREEERGSRRAGFGFWKRKGRVRDVLDNGGKVILGRRNRFVFYLHKCNGKSAVRTDWIMYEYSLIDDIKASFVACRVFVKPRCGNSISEHALSSCAEESGATVRHIGIQHDGSDISVIDGDKAHAHDCVYQNTVATGLSTRLMEENLVTSPGHAGSTNMLVDSVTARDLISILDGDFIELDDLV